jgi:CTP:molybdopterin cytidylyltransferase MocA
MFSSIRCAARWPGFEPAITHVAISLGDQPQIQPGTLSRLIASVTQDPAHVWQPSFAGRPKHPVILPRPTFTALAQTSCATLREFLTTSHAPRSHIEIDDPSLAIDLDTPEDYQRALASLTSTPREPNC